MRLRERRGKIDGVGYFLPGESAPVEPTAYTLFHLEDTDWTNDGTSGGVVTAGTGYSLVATGGAFGNAIMGDSAATFLGGDFIHTADYDFLKSPTTPWCVDFRLMRSAALSEYSGIVAFGESPSANLFLRVSMVNTTTFRLIVMGVGYAGSDITIAEDTWVHIAVTYDGAGNFRFFKDGTLIHTEAIDTSGWAHPIDVCSFAGDTNGTLPRYLHIDELRVVNGDAVWTASFTIPSAPYTGG